MARPQKTDHQPFYLTLFRIVVSYSGKYRPMTGRSKELRMLVLASRSRRNSNDFSTSFSAETWPPVSFSWYAGSTVTLCVVVVRFFTTTLKVWLSILLTVIIIHPFSIGPVFWTLIFKFMCSKKSLTTSLLSKRGSFVKEKDLDTTSSDKNL